MAPAADVSGSSPSSLLSAGQPMVGSVHFLNLTPSIIFFWGGADFFFQQQTVADCHKKEMLS